MPVSAPSIKSDLEDYPPGGLVTLTGANWQPGESVHIFVNDDFGSSWSRNVDVIADASGNITDQFNLPNWFVAEYSVTATGAISGPATTSFTDNAGDGKGAMVVTKSPVTTVAGSTDNVLTFTYTSSNGSGQTLGTGSVVTIEVPSTWTAPTASNTAGGVTVSLPGSNACTSATLGTITGTGPWTIPINVVCGTSSSIYRYLWRPHRRVTAPTVARNYTFPRPQFGRTATGLSTQSPLAPLWV